MKRVLTAGALGLLLLPASLTGQRASGTTHRLEATPDTVAYGYYWADAKPALRISSGDVIDVDTLLCEGGGLCEPGVEGRERALC